MQVMLSDDELANLDENRGILSRAEALRTDSRRMLQRRKPSSE